MSGQHQDLWPHEPKSLLPLLEQHLPHSLPVQALIITTESAQPKVPVPPAPCPQLSDDEAIAHVWCTFPPKDLGSPPKEFNIIAILPRPQEVQTRSYCSAEALDLGDEEESTAARLVVNSHMTLQRLYPFIQMAGGLHQRWVEPLHQALGTPSTVNTFLWLNPEGGSPALELDENAVRERLEAEGLLLDCGRDCDAEIICESREAQTPLPYYFQQLPQTTVLRPISAPGDPPKQAICWIMTHAAGDLGVLYTVPEWRRKGLAKIVTAVRLKESAKGGVRGFVWVFSGNKPSNTLWENLGWERRKATAQWVYFTQPETFYGQKYKEDDTTTA